MRALRPAAVMSLAFLIQACGANFNSIYRTEDFNSGISVITDAKQRVVTNIDAKSSDRFFGRIEPRRVVCTEPSPDVAQSLATAMSSSLAAALKQGNIDLNVAARLGFSSAEAIAQLGERLATIQLLRDELSDLCRAYANGAVSATTYTLRLSKLDKKMVTLLVTETAAGAFGRRLAGTSGTADSGIPAEVLPSNVNPAKPPDAVKPPAPAKAPDAAKAPGGKNGYTRWH